MALPHDNVVPDKKSNVSKKQQVTGMFNSIAGKYDFMNRFLSAGIDISWRKKALRRLKKYNPRIILDVATGTGDMAILAVKLLNPQKVIGIDLSTQMIAVGKQKIEKEGLTNIIQLHQGDSETINQPEQAFDAVTVAFGVRNFENLEKGLREIHRVLKTGAPIVVLEFSKPKNTAVRSLYNLYCGIIAPEVARWFTKNKKAYQYLNASANVFPEREAFTSILKKVGFIDTEFKPLSLGICCIYCGIKG